MAHIKKGLDYFPLDVDFFNDYKILTLGDEFGPCGVSVYIYLLTEIYREGYYLEQPLEKVATFAVRALGSRWITKDFAINVITYCGDIGLFRVDLLEQGILTSEAIQRRYQEATKRRVNNGERKYWLISEEPLLSAPKKVDSVTESEDSVTESEDSATFRDTKKRKVKKRKEKETESQSVDGLAAAFTRPQTYGLPRKDCPECGGTGWVIRRNKDKDEAMPCKCRKKEE